MSKDSPFSLAEIWEENMKSVGGYHLEVTQSVFQELGVTEEKLRDALWHARCEWDV